MIHERPLPSIRNETQFGFRTPFPAAERDRLKRRRRLDRVLRWFRSCPICTTSLGPMDFLCDGCWKTFDRIRNRGAWLRQKDYSFPVYSLLTWTEETERFVRPFIYGLKGGLSVGAYEKLIHVFLNERFGNGPELKPLLVVPPSSSGRVDHAAALALLLGEAWDSTPLWLENPEGKRSVSQKSLSVEKRAERRFEQAPIAALAEAADIPRVFIDDVITSGATARAAQAALANPDRFEAWTLVNRPKLAAFKRF